MSDEKRVYTLKEIADELKIDKQKVYRFVLRNHISEVHHEVLHDVLHIDANSGKNSVKYYNETAKKQIVQGMVEENTQSTSSGVLHDVLCDALLMQRDVPSDVPDVHHDAVGNEVKEQSEVDFLRNQIMRINEHVSEQNEQMRRQVELISSLNRELAAEREHNREKDKMLMETLSKLAETQAALAVAQSAEKQKELAETLLEGQQKIDKGRTDAEAEVHEVPEKRGWLRRVWNAVTGKDL